jgi:hypothetical protein
LISSEVLDLIDIMYSINIAIMYSTYNMKIYSFFLHDPTNVVI